LRDIASGIEISTWSTPTCMATVAAYSVRWNSSRTYASRMSPTLMSS
jgi:hypothetical protein